MKQAKNIIGIIISVILIVLLLNPQWLPVSAQTAETMGELRLEHFLIQRSGAITTALVLSTPIDVPLFTLDVKSRLLVWICQHSRLIFATATALLMSVGLISIVSNIQDIMSMRVSMARSTKKSVS